VTINGLSTILKNPFYVGLMRIVKTGQTFEGVHEPLVSTDLFEKVQGVLAGKRVDRSKSRVSTYSRIARCGSCGYSLIAERQKGHIYYRCHNRPFKNPPVCPPTSVREEEIDHAMLNLLAEVELSESEIELARATLREMTEETLRTRTSSVQAQGLQLEHVEVLLAKLTDALIEGTIDKSVFAERQKALLLERACIKEKLAESESGASSALASIEKTVELAKSSSNLYKTASLEKRRELLKILLSNLTVSGKNVAMTLAIPFRLIAEREKLSTGGHHRGTCRTWGNVLNKLAQHFRTSSLAA